MTEKLTIESANPDWHGTYLKSEIQKEMLELGIILNENDEQWLDWTFDHVFDSKFPSKLQDAFIACNELVSMDCIIDNCHARVTKS